ncbi:Ganglioside-induced differentiation-associated protein 2 [Saguinus oedipus]|uniref:Ganglioside-induced differentiation-associated protein 2 n=1 Tax=Saguinus oedipus TaxID=9490 RepID=A0ABQ9VBJ3_SAGOE|nr:Ganglioside-induced differentiation-associated protein 2 [Saguinus oedipus]
MEVIFTATYQKLLPLYFPRSLKEENRSLPYLPADIGNAEGEPVVPERQIRISEKPGAPEDNQEEEDEGLGVDLSFIGSHAFARMEGDIDKQRKLILQGQLSEAALQKQHQRNGIISPSTLESLRVLVKSLYPTPNFHCWLYSLALNMMEVFRGTKKGAFVSTAYNRWLCQARSEDLSDIASLKALYQTGVDNCGRTVMVVVGRNIPVTLIDMDKALLYFIHVMDHIAVKEYVLVYFHTLTSEYNHLDSDFLKKLYDVVDVNLLFPGLGNNKQNINELEHVKRDHMLSSEMRKDGTTATRLKDKIHHVDSLQQLFSAISPEQIDFPPFVLEYDARREFVIGGAGS